jgi:hypothetical protein
MELSHAAFTIPSTTLLFERSWWLGLVSNSGAGGLNQDYCSVKVYF